MIIVGDNYIILPYGKGVGIGEDDATVFLKKGSKYIYSKQNKYLRKSQHYKQLI